MELISGNNKSYNWYFGDGLQFTNWVLDEVATCHMTPQVSDFISGSLEDTGNYIEVMDGHYIMGKQKVQVQIRMCNNNENILLQYCTT